MEEKTGVKEGLMVRLMREHKKLLLTVYHAVVILIGIAAAIYVLRVKLFVGEQDASKSLTIIDLLLAPNSTRPFGVGNLNLILPTLLYLLPCAYMCFMSIMSAFRRFRMLYVHHDEEHCGTYKDSRRMKFNITIYLYTLVAGVITSFVQVQGVTYRLSNMAFGLFLFASVSQLWELAAGYILSDGVAKKVFYTEHRELSAAPPKNPNYYSIYRPDNMVEKGVLFYSYIGSLLLCSVMGLIILLCFPLYHVERFGVEFARVSLINYIGDANHMLKSLFVGGDLDAQWAMALVSNCRSVLMVIGWFTVLVYLVVKLIPYYVLTAVYGMTYQDKKTIASFSKFMLFMSVLLWFLTTAEVIGLYSLEVGEGLRACWPSLAWLILCIAMVAITSILASQFRYRTDGSANCEEDGYTYVDMEEVLVGSVSTAYYIRAFRYGIYWNWSAFLLGSLWLAYRKMYGKAVLVFALQSVLSSIALLSINDGNLVVALLAIFVIPVCLGLFGNLLYHRHIEQHVDKALMNYHPSLQLEYVSKKGGTSAAAVIIFLIIQGLATFIEMAAIFS